MLVRGVLFALWLGGCYEDRPAEPASAHRKPPSSGATFDSGTTRKPAKGTDGSTDAPPPAATVTGPLAPIAPIAVEPEAGLRVAFFGDQSIGPAARSVLQLVAREHAAMIVHAGDLSYGQSDPRGWEAQINEVLGPSFPYLVAIGNHDVDDWLGPAGFAAILQARLERTPGLACNGEFGVQSLCRYRGLELVLSGVGVRGTDHEWFLESTLSRPGAAVRLCVWHENQHDMQVGAKVDEVGWGPYKICAHHGAPIISGHEHSYARSYTLTAIGDREREHGWTGRPDLIELAPDRTVVVVSGLGGHSSRTRTLDHLSDTWWASIYANDYQMQNARPSGAAPQIQFGALFIDFHVKGDARSASAYFKTVDDQIVDQFEIHFGTP
jgi:hypothetical protein